MPIEIRETTVPPDANGFSFSYRFPIVFEEIQLRFPRLFKAVSMLLL
jgi:hypothetical protein